MRRLLIIGAGPIGVAAAAKAIARGFEVTVLERDEVGSSLERWGPVRCFTPVSMNFPAELLRTIDVDPQAYLTGSEMRAQVLVPLARSLPILTKHRVIAVSRRGMNRTDFPGHPLRAERPFVVRADSPEGEKTFEADVVLDATGGYALPNSFGTGGLPARGERSLTAEELIRDHATLAARVGQAILPVRFLLIGHGHSAANALLMLEGSGSQLVWAVRSANRRPCVEIANDPLPERQRVVARANELAAEPPAWLRVERRAVIDAVERRDGALAVRMSGNREVVVDVIASFTGFHPDAAHLAPLPVELSPVTEGNARLYRAISNITDCLAVPRVQPSDLETGEPGFYLVGSRAYGRAPTFLLQTGLQQLETLLDSL
jgi:thioredoxin reductase